MCQGELSPVEGKEEDKTVRKLQCTECKRVITMRYCPNCGHLFKAEEVDARMEIPGVNVLFAGGSDA